MPKIEGIFPQVHQVGPNGDLRMVASKVRSQQDTLPQEQLTSLIQQHHLKDIGETDLSEFLSKVAVSQAVGGTKQTFSFNSMDKGTNTNFGSGPPWLAIDQGLNLEGECGNSECVAFGKIVVIMKGFGSFSMSREVLRSPCPMCKKNTKNVNNLYIWMTRVHQRGRIYMETQDVFNTHVNDDPIKYMEFNWLDNTKMIWEYLELNVLRLAPEPTGVSDLAK